MSTMLSAFVYEIIHMKQLTEQFNLITFGNYFEACLQVEIYEKK